MGDSGEGQDRKSTISREVGHIDPVRLNWQVAAETRGPRTVIRLLEAVVLKVRVGLCLHR